ncbi:hypothetical protein AK830_g109 [Neonectria ditissima]|uniref:Zn(2)-C6 fungal-type domain-containing protein n=1 Tax=Neonectria ditissima TaxID=78410 RepID=A0A0P7BYT7_9HYPO|nr:hypothetical protein AK830_g109 [Neonectria ditissima]
MSDRDCSFASQANSETLSTPGTSSHERSISPGDSQSQSGLTLPGASPSTAACLSNPDSPDDPSITSQDPTLDEAINLNHMELLTHWIVSKDMFSLDISEYPQDLSAAVKIGLEAPYLLHEMLAFSARHLAFLHPERSASYLHQAVSHQTRAVSLFNSTWTKVDKSNCVATLLFSSILGHHLLADMLAKREPGGLDVFITHYTQCVETNRGIYTLAKAAWPLLMESELESVMRLSSGFTSRQPRGNHCQKIEELIANSNKLDESEKEMCRRPAHYLQIGFDAMLAVEEEEQAYRYQMIYSWTMLVPPEFARLVSTKRPEALVLLAYYALLLHYGRSMWQVGDAGAYILGLIGDYLGPEWDHWLEYPRKGLIQSWR